MAKPGSGASMKFRIRDALWLMMIVALGLVWSNYARRQAVYCQGLEQRVKDAYARVADARSETARWAERAQATRQECQALEGELRRLRGVVKSSLADQRDWFEIEVSGKRLVAIGRGTTESPELTMQTIEQIEAATGLEFSKRFKHFMSPISELQLKPR